MIPFQRLRGSLSLRRCASPQRSREDVPPADFVNRLLRTNFDIMHDLGDPVMRPFLQDVVQFGPLLRTLLQATVWTAFPRRPSPRSVCLRICLSFWPSHCPFSLPKQPPLLTRLHVSRGPQVRDPIFIPRILQHVGLFSMADWLGHFTAMGLYSLLHHTLGSRILASEDHTPVKAWLASLPEAQR